MVLGVQVLQALAGDVRIDLGGRQIAVTQEHLHHAQVRAVIEQVGCKGMAQGVRRQFLLDARLLGIALDDVPERLDASCDRRGASETDSRSGVPTEFPPGGPA